MQFLYKLQSKDSKSHWTDEDEQIFKQVKQKLKNNLELFIPDMNDEFTLESDASYIGSGACIR